jgi:hypothetical protein
MVDRSEISTSLIIESSSMETLTAERRPEGLIAPLLRKDWETALTVILHSPHWTKRVNWGLPLHVAIGEGAPVEVVTALLEAYPDATTIRDYNNYLPCHLACCYGISSEGMKMLLRCNPDAVDVITDYGRTLMQCLNQCNWQSFADEKEQVRNDLKQCPSYWKSKEQQALLQRAFEETDRRRSMRRSVARIILGRQLDSNDLIALVIEYLWGRQHIGTELQVTVRTASLWPPDYLLYSLWRYSYRLCCVHYSVCRYCNRLFALISLVLFQPTNLSAVPWLLRLQLTATDSPPTLPADITNDDPL